MTHYCKICGGGAGDLCVDCLIKAVEKALRSKKDQCPGRRGNWGSHPMQLKGWEQGRAMLRKRVRDAIAEVRREYKA